MCCPLSEDERVSTSFILCLQEIPEAVGRLDYLDRIQYLDYLFLDLLDSVVAAAIVAGHVRLRRSPPRVILAH